MRNLFLIIFITGCFFSCDDILKKEFEKSSEFTNIKYTKNRKHTETELAKFLSKSIKEIGINNSFSYKGDIQLNYIDISVENPDFNSKNDSLTLKISKEIYKLLEKEIKNLNEFHKVRYNYFSKHNFEDAEIRLEKELTIEVPANTDE
ncbi:MAG: hypothetical protein ACSHWW_13640 [Nonlabens sp.]|uniref:hypothetical protein n=1 Tax=Nonlabens sp. TaxID=1888209 RepID=UPI003EF97B59